MYDWLLFFFSARSPLHTGRSGAPYALCACYLEQTGKADGGLVLLQWQWGLKNKMNWFRFWDVGNLPAILDRPHCFFVPPPLFSCEHFSFFIFFLSLYAPKTQESLFKKNSSGGDQSGPIASMSSLQTLTLLASLSVHLLWLHLLARWVPLAFTTSIIPSLDPQRPPRQPLEKKRSFV